MTFTPVPFQQLAIDDSKAHLKAFNDYGICVVSGAGGKSVIIGAIADWVGAYPNFRVLIVTHRKELLQQNIKKLQHKSVGLVSAGLNKFEYDADIIVGGIQTVYNKADKIGKIDLILIDECQSLGNNAQSNSRYWQLLKAYPSAKMLGFTALPHRLSEGLLTWGKIYHITTYKHLLEEGYVTRISNKVTYKPYLKDVKKVAGEYVMDDFAEKAYGDSKVLKSATEKCYAIFKEKKLKKAICFAPNVKYANIIGMCLHEAGFKVWSEDGLTAVLTGDLSDKDREEILRRHKEGEYDVLVNVEILTEGYDDPELDMLINFRATQSLSLWHQMLYRICRLVDPSVWALKTKEERLEAIAKGKKPVAYLLDFAGNLKEHGGLADTSWKFLDGSMQPVKETEGKICPACEELVPISSDKCPECGYVPTKEEREVQLLEDYDYKTDIDAERNPHRWYRVSHVKYEPEWRSSKGKQMLRVTYQCGKLPIFEYIWKNKERKFLIDRGYSGAGMIDWDNLKKPTKLLINTKSKYNDIIERSYD